MVPWGKEGLRFWGSSSVASRAPGVEDSAIVMRRAPGGVSPFNARQDETASASPRLHSGDSGTIPEKRDPGSTEETRLSFDGVSPLAKPSRSGVTPREAAINLANCIMGAGALSLPSFFKSTGAVLGVALLLASCAWTWFSAVMMVKAADAVSVRVLDGVPVSSYEELMDLTLGRNGKRLSAVGILLLQIGVPSSATLTSSPTSRRRSPSASCLPGWNRTEAPSWRP